MDSKMDSEMDSQMDFQLDYFPFDNEDDNIITETDFFTLINQIRILPIQNLTCQTFC